MEIFLAGLVRNKCVVDILVIGESFEEHLGNLTEVMQKLRQIGLRLMCLLAKRSVTYLGYVSSKKVLPQTLRSVESVKNFPVSNIYDHF